MYRIRSDGLVGAPAGVVFLILLPPSLCAASIERVDEVARRRAQVMPFDLERTRHVFAKWEDGGLRQVTVKNPAHRSQIRLIREQLSKIAAAFAHGDFSAPARIHGDSMPGLTTLRQVRPGKLLIGCPEVAGSAAIRCASRDPVLVDAITNGSMRSCRITRIMPCRDHSDDQTRTAFDATKY